MDRVAKFKKIRRYLLVLACILLFLIPKSISARYSLSIMGVTLGLHEWGSSMVVLIVILLNRAQGVFYARIKLHRQFAVIIIVWCLLQSLVFAIVSSNNLSGIVYVFLFLFVPFMWYQAMALTDIRVVDCFGFLAITVVLQLIMVTQVTIKVIQIMSWETMFIYRPPTTVGSSNSTSIFLLFVAMILTSLIGRVHKGKVVIFILELNIILLGMLLCQTRSTIIGLLVFLLSIVGLRLKDYNRTIGKMVISIVAGIFMLLIFEPTILTKVLSRFVGGNGTYYSDLKRISLATQGLLAFSNKPFFGTGFGLGYGRMNQTILGIERYANPHNQFIAWLIETGVFGTALYIAFLLSIFWSFKKDLVSSKKGVTLKLGALVLLVFISFFESFLTGELVTSVLPWILIGISDNDSFNRNEVNK